MQLFQEQWVDYEDMCALADALHLADKEATGSHTRTCLPSLAINPYKSMIPFLGYFDISVILKALDTWQKGQLSGHITVPSDIDALDLPPSSSPSSPGVGVRVRGFLVNVLQDSFLGMSSRHWFSVLLLPAGGCAGPDADTDTPPEMARILPPSATASASATAQPSYWNLDSKLHQPTCFRGPQELKAFLRGLVAQHAAHVFVVSAPVSAPVSAASGTYTAPPLSE